MNMSNAGPPLAAAAAFVQVDRSAPKEIVQASIKSSSTSTSPAPNSKLPSSSGSSLSTSTSSSSEVNSSATVSTAESESGQLNHSMTNNATTAADVTTEVVSNHSQNQPPASVVPVNTIKSNGKASYYHPNQQQQQQQIQDMNQQHFLNHHPIPINLNHFNTPLNGPGLQYIQLNSNSNSTSISNGNHIQPHFITYFKSIFFMN